MTWQGVTETKPGEIVRPTAAALEVNPAPENQIRASVYSTVLRHELPAGEPILQAAIAKPGERGFPQVVLTPGERAIAIPVATGGASTGLLTPGDRSTRFSRSCDHSSISHRRRAPNSHTDLSAGV